MWHWGLALMQVGLEDGLWFGCMYFTLIMKDRHSHPCPRLPYSSSVATSVTRRFRQQCIDLHVKGIAPSHRQARAFLTTGIVPSLLQSVVPSSSRSCPPSVNGAFSSLSVVPSPRYRSCPPLEI